MTEISEEAKILVHQIDAAVNGYFWRTFFEPERETVYRIAQNALDKAKEQTP